MHSRFDARKWVLSVLRYIPLVPIVEWLEKTCQSPRDSQIKGRLKILRKFPYFVAILEASEDPKVTKIVLMFGSQVGKTVCLMCIALYKLFRRGRDFIFYFPTDVAAQDFATNKWWPFVEGCDEFAEVKPERSSNLKIMTQAFKTAVLRIRSAGSSTNLKQISVPNVALDEIDEMKDAHASDQGSTDSMAEERSKAQADAKLYISSTPTKFGRGVSKHFAEGTQEHWHVPCPFCGVFFAMEDEHFKVDPIAIRPDGSYHAKRAKETMHIECPSCKGKITEASKESMVVAGHYVAYNKEASGEVRSFRVPSFNAILQSWWTMMKKKLSGLRNIADERAYVQGYLAKPWMAMGTNDDDKIYRAREGEYGELQIISKMRGIIILTIDVQNALTCWYAVWFLSSEGVWLLKFGHAMNPDVPYFETQRFPWGEKVAQIYCYIDSGDQTIDVLDWCKREPGRIPVKGATKKQVGTGLDIIRRTYAEKLANGEKDPNGIIRYLIAVQDVAELWFADIQRKTCRIHFHKGTPDEFYAQLIAESRKVETDEYGDVIKWSNPNKKPNHAADLCRYMLATKELHRDEIMELTRGDFAKELQKSPKEREEAEERMGWWDKPDPLGN